MRMYPAGHLHSKKTRRSTLREEHPSGAPRGDRSHLPDSGRRTPGTRRASGDPAYSIYFIFGRPCAWQRSGGLNRVQRVELFFHLLSPCLPVEPAGSMNTLDKIYLAGCRESSHLQLGCYACRNVLDVEIKQLHSKLSRAQVLD